MVLFLSAAFAANAYTATAVANPVFSSSTSNSWATFPVPVGARTQTATLKCTVGGSCRVLFGETQVGTAAYRLSDTSTRERGVVQFNIKWDDATGHYDLVQWTLPANISTDRLGLSR